MESVKGGWAAWRWGSLLNPATCPPLSRTFARKSQLHKPLDEARLSKHQFLILSTAIVVAPQPASVHAVRGSPVRGVGCRVAGSRLPPEGQLAAPQLEVPLTCSVPRPVPAHGHRPHHDFRSPRLAKLRFIRFAGTSTPIGFSAS